MFSRLVVLLCFIVLVNSNVFDEDLYESVLDPTLCDEHLALLSSDTMGLLQFIDASGKIPNGILRGGLADLGLYEYCLSIDQLIQDQQIQGKYCSINVPLPTGQMGQAQLLNEVQSSEAESEALSYSEMRNGFLGVVDGSFMKLRNSVPVSTNSFTLGVCVPRACTPTQAMQFYLNLVPGPISPNVTITERFCRLPGDKPFGLWDLIAFGVFGFIGLVTFISTGYELAYLFLWKSDPKLMSRNWTIFSVFTNTRRFVTVTSVPGALDCLDGIRTISMLWVILGHAFTMTMAISVSNMMFVLEFVQSLESVWISAAPITVDTFFLLSGILCVYSTIGKISRTSFIQRIPLFYLHRLLRIFPLLATMVLLQASLINHLSDGPQWNAVEVGVLACRNNWWATLLHVQNYQSTLGMCLGQSWYLSVDVQLYLACPLVLVFLFRSQRLAWTALLGAVAASLSVCSFYSFYFNLPGVLFHLSRLAEIQDYARLYYMNTLTRAPPFVIGLVFGYLLHVYREKRIRIPWLYNLFLWMVSFFVMAVAIFHVYPIVQPGFENQLVENLVNAYLRGLWAVAVGWMIFACVQGYGGPINWFLSLRMWKLPARLSFAMYVTHYSLLYVSVGSVPQTHLFGVAETVHRFASDLVWTIFASFILSIVIDAPCSTLQKLLLGGARKPKKTESLESVVQESPASKSTL